MTIVLSRIREMREKLGFSQKRFAQMVGVSEMTVRRWEAALRSPSTEALIQIASVLNTNVSYLISETDDPSPPSKFQVHLHLVKGSEEVDDFLKQKIPPLPENVMSETDGTSTRNTTIGDGSTAAVGIGNIGDVSAQNCASEKGESIVYEYEKDGETLRLEIPVSAIKDGTSAAIIEGAKKATFGGHEK